MTTRTHAPADFDHQAALLCMLRVLTLDDIARYCGGVSASTVARWRDGSYPAGPEWDRLKALHAEFMLSQSANVAKTQSASA